MVHPNTFLKVTMMMDVKLDEVNDDVKDDVKLNDVKMGARLVVIEVDVREQFTNKQELMVREHVLQWACLEAGRLGFGVGRSKNGLDKRQTFVTMKCERNGTYQPPIRKLKRDDTGSRKCEFSFKLHGYRKSNGTWKFNVVSNICNHASYDKLIVHLFVCRLFPEKNELVPDMTLNIVV
ncbi:uncharacterized protein LOC131614479 [Vicia villosa]|uniref:uncharacterized protein LOC131614479 n=1 Tax=Vicia villosa TaxID=3911 RepID=UPI00273CD732|nr:uncharacterized protein LOC131614479 [Vicia villosa]